MHDIFFISLRRFTSGIVDRLKEYKIAHRGLGEGKHVFDFVLDNAFFNCFEATKGTVGTMNATVMVVKSSLLMEVRMEIFGIVRAVCDRCLGEFDLPVRGEMNLYVKQNERESGNDDDFIVLAPDDDFIDVSSYLYEIYMLNYPMKVVHPEGGCDSEMKNVLDEYIVEDNETPIDPRWDALRKLINN